MRALVIAALAGAALVQPAGVNYDEGKVPSYVLPDPLVFASGRRVADAAEWHGARRAEILGLFERHVFGTSPPAPATIEGEVRDVDRQALGGAATRRQVSVRLGAGADAPRLELLIYVPNARQGKVPVFLGLNFNGNHAVAADPAILLSTRWMRDSVPGVEHHRATQASRGSEASRFPLETIVERGFALVTAYYGDLEPDHPDGWKDGIRGRLAAGEEASWSWGAIGAWAWGLSRALDYLASDPDIDGTRIAVIGHSRLGKAALWAGARDGRFALVVSNDSGEGGAAITRRQFGETITRINTSFPHWFTSAYKTFNDRENDLPVDFHELLALIAPRPLYVASASEDLWADPRGEFLSAVAAEPVYTLLGSPGLGVREMPAPGVSVGQRIGYHVRAGKHDLTREDWEHFLTFAARHLTKSARSTTGNR
jgi:hypothetical protein